MKPREIPLWRVACPLLLTIVIPCCIAGAQPSLPPEVYSTPGPHVVINGALLQAPARIVSGSMMLPMRAVFEALQADVKWFATAQQITATRGKTVVQLWIGRPVAIVDDHEMPLSVAPTLFDGTTYVPLRFPAEAFGGEVKWQETTQTAIIAIAPLNASPGVGQPGAGQAVVPTPTPTPTPTPIAPPEVTGALVQVMPPPANALIVQDNAGNMAMLQLAPGAVITRGAAGEAAAPGHLSDLQLGDQVKVTPNAAGKATAVAATFAQVTGKVAALAQNKVLLQDGTFMQLRPDARVVDSAGKALALTDLTAGREVTLKITPGTDLVWAIVTPAAVAPPAPAAPAAGGNAPKILTVGAINYVKPLKAGDALNLVVLGTPNAQTVTARVGTVMDNIALTQQEPGKYVGRVIIDEMTNATNAPIFATLRAGGQTVSDVRSAQLVTIDTISPVYNALNPAHGTQLLDRNPTIGASFDDPDGSGVDPAKVAMKLDGVSVTANSQVTAGGISFPARNLTLGLHNVHVEIADRAGNAAVAEWQFSVAAPVAAEARIIAVTHDAAGPLSAGQQLHLLAQLREAPTRLEWYLGNKLVSDSAVPDAGTNNYRATYAVAGDDPIGPAQVSVRFFDAAGNSQTLFAAAPVTIAAQAVAAREFKITAPEDNAKAPEQLVVTGEATSAAKVRVTISYDGHVLILPMQGEMSKITVTTGANGVWTTQPVDTNQPLVKVDTYTVKAELLNADGIVAQTLTRTLKP